VAEIFYNNKQQQQITEDSDTDIGVCGLFILVVGDGKEMKGWYLAQAEIWDSFGTGQVCDSQSLISHLQQFTANYHVN